MLVGVTGHQQLPSRRAWTWVRRQVDSFLDRTPHLTGISSLAIGADQLFASAVLRKGGTLEVIVPFPDYEDRFSTPHQKLAYRRLLAKASRVTVLERAGTDQDCYLEAGKRIVQSCELLLAVWNGEPASGRGGTADIVTYALNLPKPILCINPIDRKVLDLNPPSRD